jgi:hypothetical protein
MARLRRVLNISTVYWKGLRLLMGRPPGIVVGAVVCVGVGETGAGAVAGGVVPVDEEAE